MSDARRLDAALARATRDGVLSRTDLENLGESRAARRDPEGVAKKLDGFAKKMEPSTYDRFVAFKTALRAQGGGVRALDLLTGKAAPLRTLPAWYPARYDLTRAADEVRDVLLAQGELRGSFDAGKAKRLVFTDADLTLLKTATPVYLVDRATGERMAHPETGRLLRLGVGPTRSSERELEQLKARFPGVAWDAYDVDYSEYASLSELLATPPIEEDLARLRRSDGDPESRDFVITARGQDNTASNLSTYLSNHDVDINGVLAVNERTLVERLGLDLPELTSARTKAVVMAAVIAAYDAASIERVKLIDDTDENLIATAELLPKLFPQLALELWDVLCEKGTDEWRQTLIARTSPLGELVDAKGRPLPREALESYRSRDHYPVDPRF
ncbi:hypothetical protein L6R52_25515, partial [Myxococcota bacterium]|nr:hypothetical protein [Myxococcota bacterium]